MNSGPMVSVITPVLNGELTIETHLNSVANQTYQNIQHIVVDNFSTDKTQEICERHHVMFVQHGPERTAQSNHGVKIADGKYVFITGSDMEVDVSYIEECVTACESEGYDAIYASVISRLTNYISKVKGLERDLYVGDDEHEAARFFRREVFIDVGWFDEEMVLHGDDYEMQRRVNAAGYITGRINARETHLDEIESWYELFLKSFYYGYNSLQYISKYRGKAVGQLSPIKLAYFSKPKILLRNAYLLPGFILFKLIQYTAATLGLVSHALGLKFIEKLFYTLIYRRKNRWAKQRP